MLDDVGLSFDKELIVYQISAGPFEGQEFIVLKIDPDNRLARIEKAGVKMEFIPTPIHFHVDQNGEEGIDQ